MSQGLSLLDIAPATENVKIGDDVLVVSGISVKDMIALFQKYPDAQKWFSGGSMDAAKFIAVAPDAIASVIAAACGVIGNLEAEKKAASLTIETQLDILEAVGRLTFRSGFGPFVKRITEAGNLAAAVSGNSGRATDTNSQPASTPSQPSGVDPTTSGS